MKTTKTIFASIWWRSRETAVTIGVAAMLDGMVRVREVLTPGESFEGYFVEHEALASRNSSDSEHKKARSELGKRYGISWHDDMIPEVQASFGIGA